MVSRPWFGNHSGSPNRWLCSTKHFHLVRGKSHEEQAQERSKREQALLPEVLKLLDNSSYGKFIEALERQTTVK